MSEFPQQWNGDYGDYGVVCQWTREQNTAFEKALTIFTEDIPEPERWEKIAEVVPGKSPEEVRVHHQVLVHDLLAIDSGRVPLPPYSDDLPPVQVKANSGTHRKKGVAWTEEEHKLFLHGLKIFGRGDWRSIARYYVKTRNPTQVASHAQKYFLRLAQGAPKKERKRTSIHDITLNAEIDMVPAHNVQMLQHLQMLLQAKELRDAQEFQQQSQEMRRWNPPNNNVPNQTMGGMQQSQEEEVLHLPPPMKKMKTMSIHDIITVEHPPNNIPLPIHQQNWLPPPPDVTIQQQLQERLKVQKLLEANVMQQDLELQKAQEMKLWHPPNYASSNGWIWPC